MERFLYRLSRSRHGPRFILKGAVLLRVWAGPVSRPTKDIDLLGHVNNSVENLMQVLRDVCTTHVEPDGMVFDPDTVTAERIKEDADYPGVRGRFLGLLENARAAMQIDVAFGDVVVPEPSEVDYPTILDLPSPRLRGYPRESIIAEKFQAMVYLGRLNSRMKDFYDIWLLARQFDFDGPTLLRGLKATFANRGTTIDTDPVALTPAFTTSETVRKQWVAFLKKGLLTEGSEFDEVAALIAEFLLPVAAAAEAGEPFKKRWSAPGPWKDS